MTETVSDFPATSKEPMLLNLKKSQRRIVNDIEYGDLTWRQTAQVLIRVAFFRDGLIDYPPMAEISESVRRRYESVIVDFSEGYMDMIGVKNNV